jgi:hypothetical protein
MRERAEDLTAGNVVWGETAIGHVELPAGTDLTPMFKGLPDDACPCPHWGYVIKGAVHVKYTDGTQEVAAAGDVFYWPAGHTGSVDEDTIFVDFSPAKELKQVLEHIARVRDQSS